MKTLFIVAFITMTILILVPVLLLTYISRRDRKRREKRDKKNDEIVSSYFKSLKKKEDEA